MIVSNNLTALEKIRFWATQARDEARHYQHSEIGYNYRLSNLLAAIGRGQLRTIEERIKKRRAIFNRYYENLSGIDGLEFIPEAAYGQSTHWLSVLTIDPHLTGVTSLDIIEALEKENIESRPVWKPMHLQPLFKEYQFFTNDDEGSVSDQLYYNGICLPSGSSLREEEHERVIECILKTLRK